MNSHSVSTRMELAWQGIVQAFMAFRRPDGVGESQQLSMTQWRLLALLEQQGPMRPGEITTALGILVPATSRLLRDLELDGFISRQADDRDRRATIVTLTESGSTALESFQSSRRAAMQVMLGRLGEDEREELAALFERIERIVRDAANAETRSSAPDRAASGASPSEGM